MPAPFRILMKIYFATEYDAQHQVINEVTPKKFEKEDPSPFAEIIRSQIICWRKQHNGQQK
jgi:hypothetical protein